MPIKEKHNKHKLNRHQHGQESTCNGVFMNKYKVNSCH